MLKARTSRYIRYIQTKCTKSTQQECAMEFEKIKTQEFLLEVLYVKQTME